ncbi:MAG: DegV family protein [Firmicutes bacterium]|nr:DegV family protein [Bacillota bacterium]
MNEKVAIMTDSTCDIPQDIIEKYGIHVVPLRIVYGEREYRDNVDITAEQVYEDLPTEIPTTSLPSPEDVLNLFHKLKDEGFTHVLAIHISSGLSGTAQMIENLSNQIKGLVVKVIDSKSISMGLGYSVIEAAQKLQQNASFEAVCAHVQGILSKMRVFFVLGTLEYLTKGGRIGKVAGTLGQILNIKLIITVNEEGVYTTYAKVRGRKQSIDKMFEALKEQLAKSRNNVAVCHGAAVEEAQALINRIKELCSIDEIITGHVSPVIGVHTGPGTLGIAVYSTD